MNSLSTSDAWMGRSIGEHERYRIQYRLGGGSMGDVFIAMDTRLGQEVAIKILKSNWAATEELSRRFEHEVALCAALRGDHVVQVSDYGITPEGYPFYVMEYLKGRTLGQLMRQERQLAPKQAINIIAQVCKGLELAHSGVTLKREGDLIKVVHRDLKPENIFLTETSLGELVKILDFGIAKIQHAQRENTHLTSMFMGTFRYASPEQVEVRQDLDARSDIYSLGIILYEMLSGTNPFGLDPNSQDISQMSWAIAHASKVPVPLRSQPGCEHLSLELEAIVMRCLQKQPQDRFASAIELRHALQAAIETTHSSAGNGSTHPSIYPPTADVPIQATFPPPSPTADADPAQVISLSQSSAVPDKTRLSKPLLSREQAKPTPRNIPLVPVIAGFGVAVIITLGLYFWSENASPPPPPVEATPVSTGITAEMQLKQANDLAAAGKLAAAIAAASQIPGDDPVHANAQQQIENWSKQILATAETNFRTTNSKNALEQAIARAQSIPASSAVSAEAQAKIKQWRTEWQTAEQQIKAAKAAEAAAQWDTVLQATQKIPQIRFWQEQAKSLSQTANLEIQRAANQTAPEPTYVPPAPEPTYVPPAPEPTYVPPAPEPTYVPPAPEPTYVPPAPTSIPPVIRPSGNL